MGFGLACPAFGALRGVLETSPSRRPLEASFIRAAGRRRIKQVYFCSVVIFVTIAVILLLLLSPGAGSIDFSNLQFERAFQG